MQPYLSTVRAYFAKLGFASDVADIYLALYTYGPQTISALSRNSKVERTRIYRLVDTLLATNLIELESHSKRGVIKAAPIENLRITINQREEELKNLTDELELIEQALARSSVSNATTQIQLYYGKEGLRHMLNKQLSAKGEILVYGRQELIPSLNGNWQAKHKTLSLKERILLNPLTLQKSLLAGDNISYHIIDKATLHVANVTVIYDNTIAYYHQKDGEVFGTELNNEDVANMQRNLFEVIWSQSQPLS